jgi:hypothetical protein
VVDTSVEHGYFTGYIQHFLDFVSDLSKVSALSRTHQSNGTIYAFSLVLNSPLKLPSILGLLNQFDLSFKVDKTK